MDFLKFQTAVQNTVKEGLFNRQFSLLQYL